MWGAEGAGHLHQGGQLQRLAPEGAQLRSEIERDLHMNCNFVLKLLQCSHSLDGYKPIYVYLIVIAAENFVEMFVKTKSFRHEMPKINLQVQLEIAQKMSQL